MRKSVCETLALFCWTILMFLNSCMVMGIGIIKGDESFTHLDV